MTEIQRLCEELETKIQETYTSGVTLEEAERLSARFLHAQMVLSRELRHASLDAKMRKSGVKSVRAAVYLNEVQKSDKKPTEAMLSAIIDTTDIVNSEEESLYKAETSADELSRYYDIFGQAHVYYRQVSKGVQG